MRRRQWLMALAGIVLFGLGKPQAAAGDVILEFQDSDFGLTTVFNDTQTFNFRFQLAGDLRTGVWDNPEIVRVDYRVFGRLPTDTPSGFPAFDLRRTIIGDEFYAQGSSLSFVVDDAADLSDGIQVSELVGTDVVFTLNAREVGTGRYHPRLIELRADGTGRIQNSNNMADRISRADRKDRIPFFAKQF